MQPSTSARTRGNQGGRTSKCMSPPPGKPPELLRKPRKKKKPSRVNKGRSYKERGEGKSLNRTNVKRTQSGQWAQGQRQEPSLAQKTTKELRGRGKRTQRHNTGFIKIRDRALISSHKQEKSKKSDVTEKTARSWRDVKRTGPKITFEGTHKLDA